MRHTVSISSVRMRYIVRLVCIICGVYVCVLSMVCTCVSVITLLLQALVLVLML